jgi:hypothetical protein
MTVAAFLRCVLAAMFVSLSAASAAWAEEGAVRTAIPFKTEPTPIESHGENVGIAILLLLAGAGGVLYYVRKKLPHMQLGLKMGVEGKRLQVVEQLRLNPRSTLYLVRINRREVLIGQCGDTLSMIDTTSAPVAEQGKEASNA